MAMHLMRAEVLGYHYAHIVADAIYTVQKDLSEANQNFSALISSKILFPSLQEVPEIICFICVEYETELKTLQLPMPDEPWFCAPWECRYKPTCYTDYEPHYGTDGSLSGIVLGTHPGWRREKVEEHHSVATMGHKDRRIYYKVKNFLSVLFSSIIFIYLILF